MCYVEGTLRMQMQIHTIHIAWETTDGQGKRASENWQDLVV